MDAGANQVLKGRQIPLAPGFSRVLDALSTSSRFSGFGLHVMVSASSRVHDGKAVETARACRRLLHTRLKPGANERCSKPELRPMDTNDTNDGELAGLNCSPAPLRWPHARGRDERSLCHDALERGVGRRRYRYPRRKRRPRNSPARLLEAALFLSPPTRANAP